MMFSEAMQPEHHVRRSVGRWAAIVWIVALLGLLAIDCATSHVTTQPQFTIPAVGATP